MHTCSSGYFLLYYFVVNSYMEHKQLQHPYDVHRTEYQCLCGYSSVERTQFLYTATYPGVLDLSLPQTMPGGWLCLLEREKRLYPIRVQ